MPPNKQFDEFKILLETNMAYIRVHLANIDQHLNRLNERTNKTEQSCAENKSDILSNRRLIWGVLIGIVLAATITAMLKVFGVPI